MPTRLKSNRLNNQPTQDQLEPIVPHVVVMQPTIPVDPLVNSVEFEQIIAQRLAEAMSNYKTVQNTASSRDTIGKTHGGSSKRNIGGPTRIYTNKDFMNYKTGNFYGNKFVIGLNSRFKRMESIFQITYCANDIKLRFDVCTFMMRT